MCEFIFYFYQLYLNDTGQLQHPKQYEMGSTTTDEMPQVRMRLGYGHARGQVHSGRLQDGKRKVHSTHWEDADKL